MAPQDGEASTRGSEDPRRAGSSRSSCRRGRIDADGARRTSEDVAEGSPFGQLFLIQDTAPGGPRPDQCSALEEALRARGLPYRTVRVADPEHARSAAMEALGAGERFLVAVGGDRLVHHMVNGMLEEGRPPVPDAVLGVVAAGAPCDFIRTFGLPPDAARASGYLDGDSLFSIDAVKVTCVSAGGRAAVHHYINLAEVGLGGAIVARTTRLPSGLGRLRQFLGFWLAVARFHPTSVTLAGDRRTWEGQAHDIVVANCQYSGDGYRLSPRSWPSDGYLEVLVMKGPKSDAFTMLQKAVLGEHLPHPNIVEYRSRRLRVETERPLPIQADGQVIGTTPATFEVIPEAIRLKI